MHVNSRRSAIKAGAKETHLPLSAADAGPVERALSCVHVLHVQ